MLMKSFLIGSALALSLPLALDAASQPTPAPMAPAFLTAQASQPTPQPTPTAAPAALSPSAAAGLSVTVDAESDSVVAEEIGEDGQLASKTVSPDLLKLDSETLAAMAGGIDNDTQDVYFDPKAKQPLNEAMPGAWRVGVDPLYYELARRTLADNKDKAARQCFSLALVKDPERAKYAKDLAFDDHSADVVIAQLEGGRASARMDLQKLAEKGNRKARLYLGMDKPLTRETATASTSTAKALSGTANAVAASLTPSAAGAHQPLSPLAAPQPGAPAPQIPVTPVPMSVTPSAEGKKPEMLYPKK
jgi:hypothetical protein